MIIITIIDNGDGNTMRVYRRHQRVQLRWTDELRDKVAKALIEKVERISSTM